MQMSDIIKAVGDSTLKEFPWGCVVKDTVNLFVSNEFRLDENSTGSDLMHSLDSLGHDVRELILKATLDPTLCKITQPALSEIGIHQNDVTQEDPTVELWQAIVSPKFVVVSTVVGAVVLAAINMAFGLSTDGSFGWKDLIDAFNQVIGD
ncbi:hypothetical protein D3C85_16190 [compost metagenome]